MQYIFFCRSSCSCTLMQFNKHTCFSGLPGERLLLEAQMSADLWVCYDPSELFIVSGDPKPEWHPPFGNLWSCLACVGALHSFCLRHLFYKWISFFWNNSNRILINRNEQLHFTYSESACWFLNIKYISEFHLRHKTVLY